jgi:chromate transporter
MGRNLCPDRSRLTIALAAAALLLVFPGAIAQMGVMLGGALIGWRLFDGTAATTPETAQAKVKGHVPAIAALLVFFALLVLLPALARATGQRSIAVFDSFYRSGSLVFGGGHVILPLLRAEVVPTGWIGDDAFLAGYGAAQALPGPLFTFAGYLGTVMRPRPHAWLAGLGCVAAIFLPACLLIGGALPFWSLLRAKAWVRAALRGANAAVVGVLLAAFYNPVWIEGVKTPRDMAAALAAFGLLELWRIPPWLAVLLLAATGQWVLR